MHSTAFRRRSPPFLEPLRSLGGLAAGKDLLAKQTEKLQGMMEAAHAAKAAGEDSANGAASGHAEAAKALFDQLVSGVPLDGLPDGRALLKEQTAALERMAGASDSVAEAEAARSVLEATAANGIRGGRQGEGEMADAKEFLMAQTQSIHEMFSSGVEGQAAVAKQLLQLQVRTRPVHLAATRRSRFHETRMLWCPANRVAMVTRVPGDVCSQ